MNISQPQSHYDIIIIGGGMVGCSFASLLEQELGMSRSILVVDATTFDSGQQPGFDDRSTALSWSSRLIFESAGLWREMAASLTAIKKVEISDQGRFGVATLDCAEMQTEALGYVAENRSMGRVLSDAVTSSSSISRLAPATVESIKPVARGMALTIAADGNSYELLADLVVLAEGGRSPICGQLGIQQTREDYGQQALISNVGFERHHDNIAYERFTESGPLAVLPLSPFAGSQRAALVWTVKQSELGRFQTMTDSQLLRHLQQAFGQRLGRFEAIGKRSFFPLILSLATEQARPGLVLLGNVAHTLHPVAGQGFNLALRDARELAMTLARGAAQGNWLGDLKLLQAYLTRREFDQRKSVGFTDNLTRLFSSKSESRVLLRKSGLLSIDLLPPLRKQFTRQAMGLRL
jgi:2-octaprenyl-6-methoxyphenol hydroxylase